MSSVDYNACVCYYGSMSDLQSNVKKAFWANKSLEERKTNTSSASKMRWAKISIEDRKLFSKKMLLAKRNKKNENK